MDINTTFQYFDEAFRSGRLVPTIRNIDANRALALIPILTDNNLLNIFIQEFCNYLNSNNIILYGISRDIKIIANYICGRTMTIETTEQFVDRAYSSGHLIPKIISIGKNSIDFSNIINDNESKTIFIQEFCNYLNNDGILLTGEDHDMRIIVDYYNFNSVD